MGLTCLTLVNLLSGPHYLEQVCQELNIIEVRRRCVVKEYLSVLFEINKNKSAAVGQMDNCKKH